jgi:hypothetical protein
MVAEVPVMSICSQCLAVTAGLALASPLGAAPLPAKPPAPVRLTVTLDRTAYLPREPIWVDWALTNAEPRLLNLRPPIAGLQLDFECTDEHGRTELVRYPGPGPDLNIRQYIPLGEGQFIRGWLNLRERHRGLYGTGKFKLRGVFSIVYDYGDPYKREYRYVRGNEVAFSVVAPEGADADVVKLVDDELFKDLKPDLFKTPGLFQVPPEDPDERRQMERVWEDLAEQWLDRWETSKQVLDRTKSDRFGAAAAFGMGSIVLPVNLDDGPGYEGVAGLREAAARLTV